MQTETIELTGTISLEHAGLRFDQAVARLWPEYSREFFAGCIERGDCTLNSKIQRPKVRVSEGDTVHLRTQLMVEVEAEPEDLPLDVVYSDSDIIVINKPPALVVHPACGNKSGTLLNALLYHYPEVKLLPRAGIVHRLDKDTTGLMVVARSLQAHTSLVQQLQTRTMHRQYLALVKGELITSGSIDAPIGRHSRVRQKMAVTSNGKPAVTHYSILQRYHGATLLRLILHSGRTHQIRVHCAHIGHPVIGDVTYGRNLGQHKMWSKELWSSLRSFPRQALHAERLELIHPTSKQELQFGSDLPQNMTDLLNALECLKIG